LQEISGTSTHSRMDIGLRHVNNEQQVILEGASPHLRSFNVVVEIISESLNV